MKCYDNGSMYTVTVSAREVDTFNERWPCSCLSGPHVFQFEKRSGDLVDHEGKGDGPEALALSEDAQRYGEQRLKLPNRRTEDAA